VAVSDLPPMLEKSDIADSHYIDVKPVNRKSDRAPLFAKRPKVHPKRVHGVFRQLKWHIMAITLGVYYLTPWLRWSRGPDAPDQAVLIDFPARRFYFFFIEIWPQELFYIAGLLIMAGIGLFLISSVVGRAWCGYFCPQTVWVDLFLVVERWFEGDRNARIRLDAAPMSFGKMKTRLGKYLVWLLISLLTGGAWVFYFADAPTLSQQLVSFEAPAIAYSTIAVLTAATFVLGGFAREKVCTYMCPWPRVQGAMADEDTFLVTYKGWRGEPRNRHTLKSKGKLADENIGDCIDCNLCVAVCPMGIDIRDGQQLECITCGLCIDACNGVMEKVGRPPNLIGYDTYKRQAIHEAGGETHEVALIRPRTVIYFTLWCLIGIAILFGLATRDTLEVNVIADRNPLFVKLSDGSIRNGYTLKVRNMLDRPRQFIVRVDGLPDVTLQHAGEKYEGGFMPLTVATDALTPVRLFVIAKGAEALRSKSDITFHLFESGTATTEREDSVFRGPGE
jgi:cytochrome c oxidase accessory protein FixG